MSNTPAGSPNHTLSELSYALRHPETWPGGFEWDFYDCEKCAMGLAARMWHSSEYPSSEWIADVVGISHDDARSIFCRVERIDIDANALADAIDAYLAQRATKEPSGDAADQEVAP
jgi:hypothetical protein